MSEGVFATTRQLTGTPKVHHAYVYSQATGKAMVACAHRHRSRRTAMTCAETMLKRTTEGSAMKRKSKATNDGVSRERSRKDDVSVRLLGRMYGVERQDAERLWRELGESLGKSLERATRPRGPLPAALLHTCPKCQAERGVWCRGTNAGALSVLLHDERVELIGTPEQGDGNPIQPVQP